VTPVDKVQEGTARDWLLLLTPPTRAMHAFTRPLSGTRPGCCGLASSSPWTAGTTSGKHRWFPRCGPHRAGGPVQAAVAAGGAVRNLLSLKRSRPGRAARVRGICLHKTPPNSGVAFRKKGLIRHAGRPAYAKGSRPIVIARTSGARPTVLSRPAAPTAPQSRSARWRGANIRTGVFASTQLTAVVRRPDRSLGQLVASTGWTARWFARYCAHSTGMGVMSVPSTGLPVQTTVP